MEVIPGIHRLEAPLGDRIVCIYVLAGPESAAVVDTGLDATPQERLLPYLQEAGVETRRVRYVLNTHADMDHFGGNASLRSALPGAVFMCPEPDRPMIEDLEKLIAERYGEFEQTHGIGETEETKNWMRANARPTPIDVGVIGGEQIHLGAGWHVEILATPGHTHGHVSIYDPRSRAAIVGDAVLGAGLVDRQGSPAFPPTYRFLEAYLRAIQRLSEMRLEWLFTSHYPVYRGPAVAQFLSESRAFVERLDRSLRAELAAARAPRTMKQLIERLAPGLGRWPGEARLQLVYPLQGHLERLVAQGFVEVGSRDERLAWRWSTA